MASRPNNSDLASMSTNVEIDENVYKTEKVCWVCKQPFTLASKKHAWYFLCSKFCFHAVCAPCSKGEIFSPKYKKNSRCCNACYKAEFSQREDFKQSHIEELERQLQANETEMQDARSQHSAVVKQLAEAQEAAARIEATNKSQGLDAMRALQQKLDKKKRSTDQMRDKLASNALDVKALQEQLEAAQRMLSRLQEQTADSFRREREDLANTVQMLSARLQARKEKKKVIVTQVEEERRLKTELTGHCAALEDRVEELQAKQQSILGEKATLAEQVVTLQTQLTVASAELEELQPKKHRLALIQAQLPQLKSDIETCGLEREPLVAKIAAKKTKSAGLKSTVKELQAKCQSLEAEIVETLRAIAQLQQSRPIDPLSVLRIPSDKDAAQEAIAALKSQSESRSADTEGDRKRLADMQSAGELLAAQLADLQQKAKSMPSELVETKDSTEQLRREIEKSGKERSALGEEVQRARTAVEAKDAEAAALEAQIEELRKTTVPASAQKCCAAGCSVF